MEAYGSLNRLDLQGKKSSKANQFENNVFNSECLIHPVKTVSFDKLVKPKDLIWSKFSLQITKSTLESGILEKLNVKN